MIRILLDSPIDLEAGFPEGVVTFNYVTTDKGEQMALYFNDENLAIKFSAPITEEITDGNA
jgi:hypothetical protein